MRTTRARGQALAELAVFGSLLLLAVGILIRIGLRFNYQQDLTMRAFRNGLTYAGKLGKIRSANVPAVDYTLIEDRQVPTPADPFGLNPRTPFSSTSRVVWGKHLYQTLVTDRPLHVVYRVNGVERVITSDMLTTGVQGELASPKMDMKRTSHAEGTLTRTDGGAVATHTDATMKETITRTISNDKTGAPLVTFVSDTSLAQETHR